MKYRLAAQGSLLRLLNEATVLPVLSLDSEPTVGVNNEHPEMFVELRCKSEQSDT